jgi:hypothetical protein
MRFVRESALAASEVSAASSRATSPAALLPACLPAAAAYSFLLNHFFWRVHVGGKIVSLR